MAKKKKQIEYTEISHQTYYFENLDCENKINYRRC